MIIKKHSQNNSTPGGEGGCSLLDGGAQGVVPRGDGSHHPDRLPHHSSPKVFVVIWRRQLLGALRV